MFPMPGLAAPAQVASISEVSDMEKKKKKKSTQEYFIRGLKSMREILEQRLTNLR